MSASAAVASGRFLVILREDRVAGAAGTASHSGSRLSWWASLLAAALGGVLLDIASPGLAWWPAAFTGVALIAAAVWRQRWGIGLLAGFAAGAAFWLPHISWLTLYLGPIPWLGLCGVMVLWFAVFGACAAAATRGVGLLGERFAERFSGRRALPWLVVLAQSLVFAGLWVLREQVQGAWPYGGFAWGRLAHTQAEGPLLQAVSLLGFAGLGGAVAFACALPIAAVLAARHAARAREPQDLPRPAAIRPPYARRIAVACSGLLLVLLALVPAVPLPSHGTLRVAAVQGDSKSAIFDDRESGDVLRDHVEATEALLDSLEQRGERVDVIVWPENSAEFGLPQQPLASQRVAKLSERAGAPIVVGTILKNADGTYTNSSLVWGEHGPVTGEQGPLRYDKRYPVPFAEYMPNREFFHALVPDLVDLVQLEYSPGERPAAFEVPLASGEAVRAGLAICFDIIFDPQAVAMTDAGAEVIFAQTNNADFGRTDESVQQLAIARLRAVETGRALVNISTVGTSEIVAADGAGLAGLEPFTADAMIAEVPLVSGRTPALLAGSAIATSWCAIGVLGLVAAGFARVLTARESRRIANAE